MLYPSVSFTQYIMSKVLKMQVGFESNSAIGIPYSSIELAHDEKLKRLYHFKQAESKKMVEGKCFILVQSHPVYTFYIGADYYRPNHSIGNMCNSSKGIIMKLQQLCPLFSHQSKIN